MMTLALIITMMPKESIKASGKYSLESFNTKVVLYGKEEQTIYSTLYHNGKKVDDEDNIKIKWKSSDSNIVKVKADEWTPTSADFIPVKEGKATITESCNGLKLRYQVVVKKSVLGFWNNIEASVIPAGPKIQLKSYGWDDSVKITYKSSNPKIAKVKKYGSVQGIKAGNVTITAKCKYGTLKKKLRFLPKLDLRLTTKKGACYIKNNSKKKVTVIGAEGSWSDGDGGGIESIKMKKGKVTIKPGKKSNLHVKSECTGVVVKYCGYKYSMWFSESGKISDFYIGNAWK